MRRPYEPIEQACISGDIGFVNCALTHSSSSLEPPLTMLLILAAFYGNIDTVKLLINRGASATERMDFPLWGQVYSESALSVAIKQRYLDVARYLVSTLKISTRLCEDPLCEECYPAADFSIMTKQGKFSLLHYSIKHKFPIEFCQFLIDKGANPNEKIGQLRFPTTRVPGLCITWLIMLTMTMVSAPCFYSGKPRSSNASLTLSFGRNQFSVSFLRLYKSLILASPGCFSVVLLLDKYLMYCNYIVRRPKVLLDITEAPDMHSHQRLLLTNAVTPTSQKPLKKLGFLTSFGVLGVFSVAIALGMVLSRRPPRLSRYSPFRR